MITFFFGQEYSTKESFDDQMMPQVLLQAFTRQNANKEMQGERWTMGASSIYNTSQVYS